MARRRNIPRDIVATARRLVSQTADTVFIIEGDNGDYRSMFSARPDYLDDPEFDAFDCKVIAELGPDGSFIH